MDILAVASQKGGCGKTTLAMHLGVMAADSRKTLIMDLDPQESLYELGLFRQGRPPEVRAMKHVELRDELAAAREAGVDLVILDTPPHLDSDLTESLKQADRILVPMRASVIDLITYKAMHRVLSASGRPSAVILSAVPARAAEIADVQRVLANDGVKVAPLLIRDRMAYRRALAHGQAVTEFPRAHEAKREISELWAWVQDFLR